MTTSHLLSLHTALVDAREGYAKALEKAGDPAALSQLRAADALHAAAHADIHRVLTARGAVVNDDGSLMGTIHKTVVSVRSALAGLDEGSLGAFASGETHTLKSYDDAIQKEGEGATREMLSRHRDALTQRVAEMQQHAG